MPGIPAKIASGGTRESRRCRIYPDYPNNRAAFAIEKIQESCKHCLQKESLSQERKGEV
jgi:hypothetical protein